jgi:hypothetical protein
VSVIDTKTAVWVHENILFVADLPSCRLVNRMDLDLILEIAFTREGKKIRTANEYDYTRFVFDSEKAYGIVVSEDYGSSAGCIALEIKKGKRKRKRK